MALVSDDLADILFQSLGDLKDKDDNTVATTFWMKQYALGYCTCLKAGLVNNLSGTVLATSLPTGGPIIQGKASNGLVVLVPGIMVTITTAAFPPLAYLLISENTTVINYVMTAGRVSFPLGSITGTATCTPLNPGPLTAGQGVGGSLSLLDGDVCTALVQAQTGIFGPLQKPFYTALMNYTMAHAEITYAPGTVSGGFSPGGGPLIAGTGAGGTVR